MQTENCIMFKTNLTSTIDVFVCLYSKSNKTVGLLVLSYKYIIVPSGFLQRQHFYGHGT